MITYLPIPILVMNDRLEVVEANRAVYAIFNLRHLSDSQDGNTGLLSQHFLKQTELTTHVGAATMRLRKPGSCEKFRWETDGRSFEISVSVLPRAEDGDRFVVVFDEKTEQIGIQRSSARIRSYLESIMSSLHLGIIVTDRNLSVANVNRVQEKILKGMSLNISMLQAVGMPLPELFADEAEILAEVAPEVLDSGAVFAGIEERYGAGKDEKVFSISFSPLRDENGQITGLIRVCEDITEKQRLEAELHRAEVKVKEVEAIRKMIITLKHQINNALMAITGNVEVLLRTGEPLSEEHGAHLKNILEWTDRIAAVTKRLEDLEEVTTVKYLEDGPDMVDTGVT